LSYSDCKFFGQSRIGLTQTEIAKLVVGLITPDEPDSEFNEIQAFDLVVSEENNFSASMAPI